MVGKGGAMNHKYSLVDSMKLPTRYIDSKYSGRVELVRFGGLG